MVNRFVFLGVKFAHKKHFFMARLVQALLRIVFALDIKFTKNMQIGEGTRFLHNGLGVVIHLETIIGEKCRIYQNVTIGGNIVIKDGIKKNIGAPVIGNKVVIYAGAVIAGPITIGDNCVIGANCVVTESIPNNCIVSQKEVRKIKEGTTFWQE